MVNQFPFGSDFVLLRDAMNQLLQDSFVPSGGARSGWSCRLGGNGAAACPWMSMPRRMRRSSSPRCRGMNPQDLEITYTQNTLTLSGSVPSVGRE